MGMSFQETPLSLRCEAMHEDSAAAEIVVRSRRRQLLRFAASFALRSRLLRQRCGVEDFQAIAAVRFYCSQAFRLPAK
jgi:hypothetical protein